MNIIKTAIQAHDANLFETNREVIFAAAAKEGAMGAAVLAAMPHYLAFPDTKERVTMEDINKKDEEKILTKNEQTLCSRSISRNNVSRKCSKCKRSKW